MKRIFLTKLICLTLITNYSFAWRGETNLYLGGVNIKQGSDQFGGIQNALGNNYWRAQTNDTSFLVGGGYFFNMNSYQNLALDLGGQVYYFSNSQSNGVIYQELTFPNLAYQYKTRNTPFYAVAKLKWMNDLDKRSAFVAEAGIGPNIIKTNDYYEESIDNGITIPNQAYHGQTRTAFSSMVGVGIRLNDIWRNASLEVGYKYFYLNKATLAPRDGVLNSLSTGPINANALVLTLVA